MAEYWPSNPGEFWTMTGVLLTVLLVFLGAIWRLTRGAIAREFEPIRQQNDRLRDELDRRFKIPEFASSVVELTDRAAQEKIRNLEAQHAQALRERDEASAREIQAKLMVIESLRSEQDALTTRLQSAVIPTPPQIAGNALGLPTGLILIVRKDGRYGAVQVVDQQSRGLGEFVRYAWWFQPDGSSGIFTNENVQAGFKEARRSAMPGPGPAVVMRPDAFLEVGDIRLLWSAGGQGFGWVYYGPSSNPSPDYELAVTDAIDISKVDASRVRLGRAAHLR